MGNEFERYKKLKIEQRRLSERVESLLAEKEEIESRTIIDTVTASDTDYPYIEHTTKVEGLVSNDDKLENHIINLELRRIRKMQDATDRALSEIRQAVDEIDDEYVRSIVTYRFIRGMSWRQVAFRMGGGITESGVRMAYNRYFEKR